MKVTFLPDHIVREVEAGTTIMQAAIDAGLKIDAPCGGNGKCGKCKVKVIDANGTETVLACKTEITGDITVELGAKTEGHRILMGGITRDRTDSVSICRFQHVLCEKRSGVIRKQRQNAHSC